MGVPYSKMKDLAGKVFGKLTAIRPVGHDRERHVIWECRCECGGTKDVQSHYLICGNTKSCGCLPVPGNSADWVQIGNHAFSGRDLEIRRRYSEGESTRALATEYGVTSSRIIQIVRRGSVREDGFMLTQSERDEFAKRREKP